MDPGDDKHSGDLKGLPRTADPESVEFLRIKLLVAIQRLAEPRADDVEGDKQGHAQPQRQL